MLHKYYIYIFWLFSLLICLLSYTICNGYQQIFSEVEFVILNNFGHHTDNSFLANLYLWIVRCLTISWLIQLCHHDKFIWLIQLYSNRNQDRYLSSLLQSLSPPLITLPFSMAWMQRHHDPYLESFWFQLPVYNSVSYHLSRILLIQQLLHNNHHCITIKIGRPFWLHHDNEFSWIIGCSAWSQIRMLCKSP